MLLKDSDKRWLCIIVQSKRKAVEAEFKKTDTKLEEEIKKVLGKNHPFDLYGMAYLYLYVTDCEKVKEPLEVFPHVHVILRKDQASFYGQYREGTVFGFRFTS
jgi:hypothetical protein